MAEQCLYFPRGSCLLVQTQMPDPKTFKQHFESRHPKSPMPAELVDVQAWSDAEYRSWTKVENHSQGTKRKDLYCQLKPTIEPYGVFQRYKDHELLVGSRYVKKVDEESWNLSGFSHRGQAGGGAVGGGDGGGGAVRKELHQHNIFVFIISNYLLISNMGKSLIALNSCQQWEAPWVRGGGKEGKCRFVIFTAFCQLVAR